MTTLSGNAARAYSVGDVLDYPVIAADVIYSGAAVGENGSGYSRPLAAGDAFQGFALAKADNAGGAAGDKHVTVQTRGYIELAIAGLAITGNDRQAVYASDDNTFTLTATSNSLIGFIARWVSTGVAVVEFDAAGAKAALHVVS